MIMHHSSPICNDYLLSIANIMGLPAHCTNIVESARDAIKKRSARLDASFAMILCRVEALLRLAAQLVHLRVDVARLGQHFPPHEAVKLVVIEFLALLE